MTPIDDYLEKVEKSKREALGRIRIGIYPYSGQVIETLKDQLKDHRLSRGATRVPANNPISESRLNQVITVRLK